MIRDERTTLHETDCWLALLRAPCIGNAALRRLLDEFSSPGAIFHVSRDGLSKYGLNQRTVDFLQDPDRDKVAYDIDWLRRPGNHLITLNDKCYPLLLKQIYDPPIALYVCGDPDVLGNLQISIVGSRNPTADGRRLAREFASRLAREGLTITSGLASGLDSYAHMGALDASGTTIAVLGSGLDRIYPAKNRGLAEAIMENGALVSEFPPDYRPIPANFPRRNRIISGLSAGTLVVEAARKSGSLITAKHALEQGREVFAIPGSIHNPLAQGCHELIRQGAKLVERIEDILEEIAPLAALLVPAGQDRDDDGKTTKGLDEHSKLLLDNIGSTPVSIDYLVDETRLAVNIVSSSLLTLELQGWVESLPGGEYIRV
ncbi:MAG: DNA-processing protein DprA [Gammaproteobacteria bacterium]